MLILLASLAWSALLAGLTTVTSQRSAMKVLRAGRERTTTARKATWRAWVLVESSVM